MTDKQIIIDGVDVSGCPSYMDNGECTNKDVYPDYCKACSNCRYKLEQQLDQLKAENERLEAHSATLDAIIETGKVQYKALKQTFIEIKEIAKKLTDDYGHKVSNAKIILQKISEIEDGQ